jgi:C-terminal processing protease CtpA/Prc
VLPGNVRYINISPGFLWDPARSPQAFDDAMRFLAGGDAYIIDIRTNGGGSPATVRYVVSHFMDAGQKLMTYRIGPEGTSESRTQAVPAGKLAAKPLYLLTSPKSASAAEEFASHIKNFKLGTLVGGTTAGAGHRNALFGTPEGFVISVSVGTAIHPVTGTGWEGTGVVPDITAPVDEALAVAHSEALKGLVTTATGPRKVELQRTLDSLTIKKG